MSEILIREIWPDDHAFIYATWLRQLWFAKDNSTMLSKDTFMRLNHKRIEDKLAREPGSVMCSKEDPTLIIGYKVGDYKYFKRAFRGMQLEKMI